MQKKFARIYMNLAKATGVHPTWTTENKLILTAFFDKFHYLMSALTKRKSHSCHYKIFSSTGERFY